MSKFAKNGFWHTNQIIITDQVGNQRFEGIQDFGLKFYLNNPLEDIIKPEYVKDSLILTKKNDSTSYKKPVQILTLNWKVNENQQMNKCYAKIDHEDPQSYSIEEYGKYDDTNETCNVNFILTEYSRSGTYHVKLIKMVDKAGNVQNIFFKKTLEDHSILISTVNQDTEFPHLDVNTISITANPITPEEPDGQTRVQIFYQAKDDKSGLGLVSYKLRDPQGIDHHRYHYHENFHSLFFKGNVDELKNYEINLVLPEGSAPGKWGLSSMKLVDKASNQKTYQFTEIIHFEKE